MSAPNRQGRPSMTEDEAQSMARLMKDRDGRMFLERLERIKRHKQDLAHNIKDYAAQMQHQGGITEIIDLQREFSDALKSQSYQRPAVNRQGRFG